MRVLWRETIDWDTLFRIAQGASFLEAEDETDSFENTSFSKVRIGIAKDEAFCFMYRENLELLSDMGAELVFFSPYS